MKKIMFSVMAVAIALYACKKDDKGNGSNPAVVSKPISPDSVQLLSDSLKLNHLKTSTKGTLPASSGSVITLAVKSNDTITAVNGGYAIITPSLNSGTASGYYVQVKGANTFLTMDFKQSINRKKSTGKAKGFLARAQNEGGDSIIAIRLPMNLLPGTFTVQYEAYDSLNNVSNVDSAVVNVVVNDQTTADFKLLQGTWNFSNSLYLDTKGDTVNYYEEHLNVADSSQSTFICNEDNSLSYDEEGSLYTTRWSIDYIDATTFNADNTASNHYSYTSKYMDYNKSTCGNPVYNVDSEEGTDHASYYYNSTTKQFIVIYDNGGLSNGEYYTEVYTVATLTANKLDIMQTSSDEVYHEVYVK